MVPNPKHQKYSRSEIVVSIFKCATVVIILLGVTFILSIHPQVVNRQCPVTRKGSHKMTTKTAIAVYPANETNSDNMNVENVMSVTNQFQERTQTLTEVKVETLSGQVTT